MKFLKKNWKWIIVAILLASGILSVYIYSWEYRKPLFEIHFFSLNKGRSIFIRTPKNKAILIGSGQNSEVIREITKLMPFYNKKIDTIIIPSAIPTQIGGFIEIIDRYEIGEIIMPELLATSTVLSQLIKNINQKKIHIIKVGRGDEISVEDDFFIKILFPYSEFKFNKTSLPELGLEISYKNTSAYLIGNLSKTIQKDIAKFIDIENFQIKKENIIEFYNSASESKVSTELINKINPKFIFSTKEQSLDLFSDGDVWQKIK